jgi:hypothetical protein
MAYGDPCLACVERVRMDLTPGLPSPRVRPASSSARGRPIILMRRRAAPYESRHGDQRRFVLLGDVGN